jgi:hypothetical protein
MAEEYPARLPDTQILSGEAKVRTVLPPRIERGAVLAGFLSHFSGACPP